MWSMKNSNLITIITLFFSKISSISASCGYVPENQVRVGYGPPCMNDHGIKLLTTVSVSITNMQPKTTMKVCNNNEQHGWITSNILASSCQDHNSSYPHFEITKYEDLTDGDELLQCGGAQNPLIDEGFASIEVIPNGCGPDFQGNYETRRRIKKLHCMPEGHEIISCERRYSPPGYTSIAVTKSTDCEQSAGRLLKKISNFAITDEMIVCEELDITPSGWISIQRHGECGRIGDTTYFSKTIRKVDEANRTWNCPNSSGVIPIVPDYFHLHKHAPITPMVKVTDDKTCRPNVGALMFREVFNPHEAANVVRLFYYEVRQMKMFFSEGDKETVFKVLKEMRITTLIIPGQERNLLLGYLTEHKRKQLRDFVHLGGVIIVMGSSRDRNGNDVKLINTLFGFNLKHSGSRNDGDSSANSTAFRQAGYFSIPDFDTLAPDYLHYDNTISGLEQATFPPDGMSLHTEHGTNSSWVAQFRLPKFHGYIYYVVQDCFKNEKTTDDWSTIVKLLVKSSPNECGFSSQPTSIPTSQPSSHPSAQPSRVPSGIPTKVPTISPSSQPTSQPTSAPTSIPSTQPSSQPSAHPSTQPTCDPTCQPSSQPSSFPSASPSSQPTNQPTSAPTSIPSTQPSSQPSSSPSSNPSSSPSGIPSLNPSSCPSSEPSGEPTEYVDPGNLSKDNGGTEDPN